jgi:hypothetical protein
VSRCLPRSLADKRRVCSLDRPGQRRASLAPCGGARFPTLAAARGQPREFTGKPAYADYGWGATITSSAVVDKITKAMLSSAPIATASAEMPPLLAGASGG